MADNIFMQCLHRSCNTNFFYNGDDQIDWILVSVNGPQILEYYGRPVFSPQVSGTYYPGRGRRFQGLRDDVLETLQTPWVNARFVQAFFGEDNRLSEILLRDPRVRGELVRLSREPGRPEVQGAALDQMAVSLPDRSPRIPEPDSGRDPLRWRHSPPLVSDRAPEGFFVPGSAPRLHSPAAFSLEGASIQPTVGGITHAVPDVPLAQIRGMQGERYFPIRRLKRIARNTIEEVDRSSLHFGPPPGSREVASLQVRVVFDPESVRYDQVARDGLDYYRIPLLGPEYGYIDRSSYRVIHGEINSPESLGNLAYSYPDVRVVSEGGVAFLLVSTDVDPDEVSGLQYSIVETTQPYGRWSFHGVTADNRGINFEIDYRTNPDLRRFVRWVRRLRVGTETKVELLRRWVAANIHYSFTQQVSDLYGGFHADFGQRYAEINDPRGQKRYNLVNFALEKRVGTCGIHEVVFSALVRDVLGLPTRRVEGMFGGSIIVPSHFHAWTEVYIPGRWARFDATPAAS